MTKKERNRINREIRIERALREHFYKMWLEMEDEQTYLNYQIHDYCLYVLENRLLAEEN